MRNKNNQKGITLVALIITIIILLILAGISIASLTQTGLFAKAKQAKEITEQKTSEENAKLYEYEQWTTNYENGKIFTNVDPSKTNPEAAMPTGATVIEGDANKGIVIKDNNDNDNYNEWVWVEVPKTIFTTAKSASEYNNIKTDLIEYAKDYREGKAGQGCNWTDEWYNGCGLTNNEYQTVYQKMLSSVYTNGGFWISRYEIGDSKATTDNAVRTSSSGTEGRTPVSRANQIPYNYVTCSQAQSLASGMSTDSNKTSSLLFGIQWDLVCKFLETKGGLTKVQIKGGDRVGSTNWGNYSNSSIILARGKYNTAPNSPDSQWLDITPGAKSGKMLLTTGASEGTNKMNIYDFAGNEYEWTLEKTSYASIPCARRGGYYNNDGSSSPASGRNFNRTTYSDYDISFRSALY